MAVEAFEIRSDLPEDQFLATFLSSHDFRLEDLKSICKDLSELSSATSKLELANRIAAHIGRVVARRVPTGHAITRQFVRRPRSWMSLKTGRIQSQLPDLAEITDLYFGVGEERWYGPTQLYDDQASAVWYVRPVLVDHWVIDEAREDPRKDTIRWLCWARVDSAHGLLSLHWNGFTRSPERFRIGSDYSRSQFEYWEYVPKLFNEIEDQTGARVSYPDLGTLTLTKMWNQYHDSVDYSWRDTSIRSRAGGVAFSARSGSVNEVDVSDIQALAKSIRKGIDFDLRQANEPGISNTTLIDSSILRTLIKDFNPHSHGFELRHKGTLRYHGHCYFGVRPEVSSPDALPHIKLIGLNECSDVQQLQFLAENLRGSGPDETDKTTQIPLPS